MLDGIYIHSLILTETFPSIFFVLKLRYLQIIIFLTYIGAGRRLNSFYNGIPYRLVEFGIGQAQDSPHQSSLCHRIAIQNSATGSIEASEEGLQQ
ncbi:hypothetical protein CDAR_6891 [Caerostris darwini]|uniref:Ycf15 n=1 Tax=Caerostris darwini TaxID=1538125 RepID=A0AAV4S8W3_9ARAC|nr:hypothetical protein CDAR_6891 [Caerostris darwini]